MSLNRISQFQKFVLSFYRHHRRDFPWRPPSLKLRKGKALDPYKILVSEVMLQRTQTDRVVPKYTAWLKQFPNFKSLSEASVAEVLRVWSGLGYNRRALALKKLAEIVLDTYRGRLPRERAMLESLPGIGPYTAGAIRAFSFNEPDVFIETNIRRVFIHHFFKSNRSVSDSQIVKLVEKSLPATDVRKWYWALMDYGAYLGTISRKSEGADANPNRKSRHYARQSKFKGSRREVRGKILKLLHAGERVTIIGIQKLFPARASEMKTIVDGLEREGFIYRRGAVICLLGESAR